MAQILYINYLLFSELKETEQGQGIAIEPSSLTDKTVCCNMPFKAHITIKSKNTSGVLLLQYMPCQMFEQNYVNCIY